MSFQAYTTAAARSEAPRDTEFRLFAQVTRALVEAAKHYPVATWIQASTLAIYSDAGEQRITGEDDQFALVDDAEPDGVLVAEAGDAHVRRPGAAASRACPRGDRTGCR